jgi:hypothetical protein
MLIYDLGATEFIVCDERAIPAPLTPEFALMIMLSFSINPA